MQLGRFGIWILYRGLGEEKGREAARLVEDLGYGTFWIGGSPQLPELRPLLEATERITIATGVMNVWLSDPVQMARDFQQLEADFPRRLLVGIGVGHAEAQSQYAKPLAAMAELLDALDSAASPIPAEARCLAALGPRMLQLAAARSLGTHTYFVPAEHTRRTRERLGGSVLIAPEMAYVLDEDAHTARAKACAYADFYLGLRNYTQVLKGAGFGDADITDGGSDRLIDAVVAQGDAEAVAAAAREHISAGADHVCLQAVGVKGIPRREWTAVAHALELGH